MTELREKLNNIVEEKNTKVIPENLRQGAEAFGVHGTFTSDATAAAEDIVKDKAAYVNGEKIIGTLEVATSDCNVVVDITGTGWYPSITKGIIIISNLDCTGVISIQDNFKNYTGLQEIKLENTSELKYLMNTFYGCTALEKINLFDTSSVINASGMFNGCTSLKEIPQFNFENNATLQNFAYGCTSLVTFPLLDTSKTTVLREMVKNCTNLSEESLYNIMQMCINATSYTDVKTLLWLGLTSTQATTCTTLSNYQAFLDAGWVTGF